MSARLALIGAAAISLAAFDPAAVALPTPARLQGAFAVRGRVTTAVHIRGEHRGQVVSRTWSFTPLCATGACRRVSLTRTRAGGTDTLMLTRRRSGRYVGSGHFYAPLRCGGTLRARGETVPFKITVRVSATTQSSTGLVVTAIHATYVNRSRFNLTPCVALPSHDAAVYTGVLRSATPAAVTARSPAGS